jgi:hypothetical protein
MRTLARTLFEHDISAVVLAVLLGMAGGFGAAPAGAQSSVPCTAIGNDTERLACYDRALRGTSPPAAAPATTAPAPAAPPDEPRERQSDRTVRTAAPPAAPAPAAAPAAAAAPAPVASSRFEAPAIVPIVVVGIRALPGRNATFTTEDGQIWVQTDGQSTNFPDVPFAAEIKPGAMGSSFLVPKDRARAVRVRRGGD